MTTIILMSLLVGLIVFWIMHTRMKASPWYDISDFFISAFVGLMGSVIGFMLFACSYAGMMSSEGDNYPYLDTLRPVILKNVEKNLGQLDDTAVIKMGSMSVYELMTDKVYADVFEPSQRATMIIDKDHTLLDLAKYRHDNDLWVDFNTLVGIREAVSRRIEECDLNPKVLQEIKEMLQ
jgi:hypothetical protein